MEETHEETAAATSHVPTTDELGNQAIRRNVYWSMGLGLIPIPLLDIVAVTGIQIKMLSELAKLYNVPFSEHRAKSFISAIIGGVGAQQVAWRVMGSFLKTIPVVGTITTFTAMPIFGGASTYAVGKVFQQHFASGGTFLSFDPAAVREYYREMYEEGKKVAESIQEESAEEQSQAS